jgi:tetratricopeptide (TPR) repeat protein
MRLRSWGTFCVLAIALACALRATAAEPRIGKFTRYDTGDFVIVTSRSPKQAREIMQKLVKFRITLEKMLGKRAARSGIGTHIVIVGTTDWEKYLQPREQIAGYFQRSRFNNYITMNGDAGEYAIYVMFHEYTHFYLSSQFAGEYPPWFNEGLAELMAYAKFTDNRTVLQIPMFRVQEARDRDWISFDRLIKIDQSSPEYQSHKLADAFYAQAWLTVHYGMVEERPFARQIFTYLSQLNTLVPQEQAARNVFGEDLGVIDAKLRAYSRNTNMGSGALDLGEVPEITLPKGEPMSDGEGLAAVIDVMLAAHLAPDRIRPLVESLQRREPNAARSYILAARLAEFEDDSKAFDAAVTQAEGSFTAGDWQSRRDLASVLLSSANDVNPMNTRTSEDTNRDLKRALKWYGQAVERNNEDAEALWGLGTVLTRLNLDLELADVALRAAYSRVPASAAISMSLASLKSRQQEPEAMIPFLKDTIRLAGDLGTRRWATETLEEMQRYVAEQKKVDEENRMQREAYEKQLADYEKKYGKKKKKSGG